MRNGFKLSALIGLLLVVNFKIISAPVLNKVIYDQHSSVLIFEFSEKIRFDNIILSGIKLKTVETEIGLGDGAVILSSRDTNIVEISLLFRGTNGKISTVQKDLLEASSYPDNIKVLVGENSFINQSNHGNEEIRETDYLRLTFVPAAEYLEVVDAVYQSEKNLLTLKFNRNVVSDADYVRLASMTANNSVLSVIENEVISSGKSDSLRVKMGVENQKKLENVSEDIFMTFNGAVRDTNYNPCGQNQVKLTVIADPNPLRVVSAQYDASINQLFVKFNKAIKDPRYEPNFFPGGIKLTDSSSGVISSLPLGYNVFALLNSDQTEINIRVSNYNQREIETQLNTSDLKMNVRGFTVYDTSGNGNLDTAGVAINFKEDNAPFQLDLSRCEYDGNSNNLVLAFNYRLHTLSGMDYKGLRIIDPQNQQNFLSFEIIEDLRFDFADKRVNIKIPGELEALVEKFSQIQVLLDPFSIYSKQSYPNGNLAVLENDLAVIPSIIADSTGPQPHAVEYDVQNGLLTIRFDEAVNFDTFDGSKIRFCNVPLDSDGQITDNFDRDVIQYRVSEASRSALRSIPDSLMIAPRFTFNEGMIRNFYDKSNPEIIDGRDGGDYLVGYGRFFWTRGKQKFPEQDMRIFAGLRKSGRLVDIYVDDAEWNRTVSRTDVDSLLYALEMSDANSLLPDSLRTGGIYTTLTKIFGAIPDFDQNGKLNILLYNIRDDYGRGGRNHTNSNIYNFGYIEPADMSSAANDPLSNETDMIYLDCSPQHVIPRNSRDDLGTMVPAAAHVIQNLIASVNYPEEERWLVEGLSGLGQFFSTDTISLFERGLDIIRAPGTELTHYYDHAVLRKNLSNAILFSLFLYERYGLDFILKMAADKEMKGLQKIQRLIENEFSNTDPYDPDPTLPEVFGDYSLASLVDQVERDQNGEVINHRFGFVNIDLHPRTQINFAPGVFFMENVSTVKELERWSYNFYSIPGFQPDGEHLWNEVLPDTGAVRVNATDGVRLMMFGVTQDRTPVEYIVPQFHLYNVPFSARNEGILPLQFYEGDSLITFRQDYKGMILALVNPNPYPVKYAFSNDVSRPGYAVMSVVKNALIERSMDIYVTADEALFADIDENPEIAIVVNQTDTVKLPVEKMFTARAEELNAHLYRASYNFSWIGNYKVLANARDIAGNERIVAPAEVAVAWKAAAAPQTSAGFESGVSLQYNDQSDSENKIYLVRQTDFSEQADRYSVFQEKELGGKFYITIPLESIMDYKRIGLFRVTESGLEAVAGSVDAKGKRVIAEISAGHTYQLSEGNSGLVVLPEAFRLFQNYPNPFNSGTTINFIIPEESKINISVYNVLGQRITTLTDRVYLPGIYKIQWNGRTAENNPVSSGLYFYRLENGSQSFVRRMLLLK